MYELILKSSYLVLYWPLLFTAEEYKLLLSMVTSHHLFYVHDLLVSFLLWLSFERLEVLMEVSWQMQVFAM